MIQIGIDAVEINRFNKWTLFSKKQLLTVFSQNEIEYCLSNEAKSAERFAAHFATKEAFYKAISNLLSHQLPLRTVCKNICLIKNNNTQIPNLKVNWKIFNLNNYNHEPQIVISLTHTKTIAVSVVVILNPFHERNT